MLSKKYIIALLFLVVIGGVIAITWSGDIGPTDEPINNDETYGLNGSGYSTGDLPHGVTVDGIAPSALSEEYNNKLSESTFTLTVSSSEAIDGGVRDVQKVYQKGEKSVHVEKIAEGETIREEYYDLENRTIAICDRKMSEDCPTAVNTTESVPDFETENVKALLVGGDWQPQTVNENTAYTEVSLKATAIKMPEPIERAFSLSNITEFSGEVTVDDRQVITEMNVSVEGDLRGQTTDIEYESQVEDLNQTRVRTPDWVITEENQTPTVDNGVSEDVRTVFVTNTQQETYDVGTTITVESDQGQTYESVGELTLDNPLVNGETVYLAVIDDELQAYQDEAPDQRGEELTADAYIITINSPDGTPGTMIKEVIPER